MTYPSNTTSQSRPGRPAQLCSLVLLVGATACSPYGFPRKWPISSGVDELSDAFSAGYDGLAADRAAKNQIVMVDERKLILVAPT